MGDSFREVIFYPIFNSFLFVLQALNLSLSGLLL